MGSRGSIIPHFISLKDKGELPITDVRMTRFMITLEQGVELVEHAFEDMLGGEIYIKKIPSMKVIDIAKAIAPQIKHKMIGIRPGEKLHEQMISSDDANSTYEYSDYYKILPQINEWAKDNLRIKNGKKVSEGFYYSSDNNSQWMTNLT
jgi:FlaA1/EpsC-like NDP-sugar epimerase